MKYLFTLFLLVAGFNLHAQLFFRAGNTATDVGRDIVRNNLGETFLASTISGGQDVNFDPKGSTPFNIRSNGAASDIVLAKYDINGQLAWSLQVGNVGEDVVHAVALDNTGAVYIVGYYRGNVQFDPKTGLGLMVSNGQREGFIAKYNQTNGNFLWSVSIGDVGNDEILDIDIDNNFNVYVGGSFEGTVDFEPLDGPGGNDTFTALGARDFFVGQYNAIDGSLNWVIPIGSIEDDPGQKGGIAVKTDQLGRVNVAGTYRLAVDFDPGPADNILVSLGEEDIFIAQYSVSGNLNWLRGVGTPNSDFTATGGIAVNLQNQIVMTGSVSGTNVPILSYTSFDQQDNLRPLTIAGGDVFFGLFDELDGSMIWGNIVGGADTDWGTAVAVDNGSNIYLAANFQGLADADAELSTFPVNSFASGNNFDTFLAQYADDGSIVWAFPLGSGNGENTNFGLWVEPNTGRSLITGRFHLSATFDGMGIPQNQLTSDGDADIYVAEYDNNGNLLLPQQNNCPAPVNVFVSNIAPTQALINFDPQFGADEYTINYRVVGQGVFQKYEGILTSPEIIIDLQPNTDYEVCVQSVCGGIASGCSSSQFFRTTNQQTCSAPALNLQSVTATSVILGWTPNNLSEYKIRYRRVGQPMFITLANSSSPSPFVILELQCNTNYEAEIINICGTIESEPSNLVTFRTLDCGGQTCNSPIVNVNNITDNSALINWSPSDIGFELNFRPRGVSNWQILSGSGSNLLLEGLTLDTEYEVRVRNNCPNSSVSDYSSVVVFRTTDPNPCKVPEFGIMNITETTAEAFWFEEIKKYEISYRRDDPTGDWITFKNIDFASPFLIETLSAGQTYSVRMRRVCGNTFSEYTELIKFTTLNVACERPELVIDQTDHRSVTVSWTPASGVAELEYHFPSELEWNTIQVVDRDNFTITGLLPGVTYEFRVRNDCGVAKSEYSEPKRTITTPFDPCPVPHLKVLNVGATSIVVSWTPNLPFYEIAFRELGDEEWNELADNVAPPFIIEAFRPLTTYQIRMRGVCNDDQFSDYSNIETFVTISDQTCDQPFLTSFFSTPTAITLDWLPASSFFEVQYRPLNGTNWLSVSGDTPPPFTLTGLVPNRTYNIRIRNSCNGQFSEFSDPFQISTPPIPNICPQPRVFVSEITLTTAEISWSPSELIFEITYRPVGSSNWQRIIRNSPPPVILTNLLEGTEYEVRVRNYCNTGANGLSGFSDYSEIENFLTQFPDPICETPSLNLSNIETNKFTIEVNPFEANIEIQVRRRDLGGNWDMYYTHNQRSIDIQNLLPNSEYEIKARRFCGQLFSDFTDLQFVITKTLPSPPCNRPTVTTVPNSVTENRASLSWKNGTLMVEISYKIQDESSWSTIRTTKVSPFTLTNLLPCKTYEARIRNFCNGEYSDYSSTFFVTSCLPPPACDAPIISLLNISPNSVIIDWANSDIVDTYEYSYRIKGGVWVKNYDRSRPPFMLSGLLADTEYEVRFRQYCNPDFSDYSEVLTFTTPSIPIKCHFPTDLAVSVTSPRSALVKWKAPEGVHSYRILYYTTNYLARITAIVNNDYVLITNLRPGTKYYFSVKSICDDGSESVFTSEITFDTPSLKEDFSDGENNTLVSLYPNPSKGAFNVVLDQPSNVKNLRLMDINGKVVWQKHSVGENLITVDLEFVATGIYILSAQMLNGEEKRFKVMID